MKKHILKYKFLPHTADIKFRAYGKTLNRCFENAGLAMSNAMYSGKIKQTMHNKFSVGGRDFSALLYNYLEKILILLDSKNFFLSKVKIKIQDNGLDEGKKLTAEVWGDKAGKYAVELDVKAITYNQMFVKKIKNNWVCQVVLDV